jgi:Cu2+-exporting ATPase
MSEAAGTEMALFLARPGHDPAQFRFRDRLRPEAGKVVTALHDLGLATELLSGDAPAVVEAAARQTGIARWTARMTPAAKSARIEALRAKGRKPLMVGDGINDAAALALAHVSASPANGTGVAQAASDVVLLGEGLSALPYSILVARRAQRLARQNILFSLSYNIVAVPAAVLGHVTPLVAALVMASSSIIVILNALRAGSAPEP